jgi:hypothetical protein
VSKWKCHLADLKQWIDISSILFSFLARSNVTINRIIMISANHATKAKQNLDVVNETIGVIIILVFVHSFFKCNLVIGYFERRVITRKCVLVHSGFH